MVLDLSVWYRLRHFTKLNRFLRLINQLCSQRKGIIISKLLYQVRIWNFGFSFFLINQLNLVTTLSKCGLMKEKVKSKECKVGVLTRPVIILVSVSVSSSYWTILRSIKYRVLGIFMVVSHYVTSGIGIGISIRYQILNYKKYWISVKNFI